jgi:2-polyprenyl-6-methoxyphenol hydroxylase-like FAD-dependent oxidoreductase
MQPEAHERGVHDCDVLILGGGLAGLCLARQLLLADPDLRILLLERRHKLPRREQKVGEATVQASGYYFSRVLEMEEHLLRNHYLKYNLRFYWTSAAGNNRYEEFSQSYIRGLSNIFTYQLDRNLFEAELLKVNCENPNFRFVAPAKDFDVDLATGGALHTFRYVADGREVSGRTRWVVDAAGRSRVLVRKLGLDRPSPIHHGTSFCWVDGLLDVEKLTDLTPRQIRLRPDRQQLGHAPALLATNHFCGEGYWFWVIPLHGRTSLGLVFDAAKIRREDVDTPDKLVAWVCRTFPCFARDLPQRKIVSRGGFDDFSLDAAQTLSADGWALCGEAGRFTDPLYSPGGDLIAIYNTLVTDAILTRDRAELESKVRMYEGLERAVYEAYVPSFAVSYETLGDQEAFSLRYIWELTIYFAFYVFPMVNDLFTNRQFVPGFLRRFSQLGPMNRRMHELLVGFYRWKKENLNETPAQTFFDFYECWQLGAAEKCFYKVGVPVEEARQILDEQLANLEELARRLAAHVAATVLGDPRALMHPDFVGSLDPATVEFDPEGWRRRLAACRDTMETWPWRFHPIPVDRFRPGALDEMILEDGEEVALKVAGGAR